MRKRLLAMLGVPASAVELWTEKGFKPANETATASAASENEALIYGPIASVSEESFWGDYDGSISNKTFRERLNAIEGDVVVRINSPGGSVFEASGMSNAMIERRNAGDTVNVIVDGLAASAASLVMLAGQEIAAAQLASIMIHRASGWLYGNAQDYLDMAKVLAGVDDTVVGLYAERTGMSAPDVRAALESETWFTAAEAIEAGLVDREITLETPLDTRPQDLAATRELRLAALFGAAA